MQLVRFQAVINFVYLIKVKLGCFRCLIKVNSTVPGYHVFNIKVKSAVSGFQVLTKVKSAVSGFQVFDKSKVGCLRFSGV